jgi:hypothetical protein
MSTNETPEETGPVTPEELQAQGWSPEHAAFLSKFDAALQGQDASIVIPTTIYALQNLCRVLTPDAQRQVASLFSEAAMQIGQAAAETEKQLAGLQQLADEVGEDGATTEADHPPGSPTVQ